jgi:two-component system, sporulation sensor kinase C
LQSHTSLEHRKLQIASAQQTGHWSGTMLHHKKTGEPVWIEASIIPLKDENGKITGYASANRDITGRVLAEEQLLRHNEELERLVAERTARIQKLERLRQESEKQVAIGRMAARIAHEINNPLAGIQNSFLLVKRGISPDFQHYEFVGRIEKEIARVARIVQRMFELHREERRELKVFAPAEAIQDVAAMLDGNCRAQGVTIALDIAGATLPVRFHEDTLRQVLFNLVQNAVEATPRGGSVTIGAVTADGRLRITVADTGCGIPNEVGKHIFEPFFTTKDGLTTGGLGLGLSVTHGLVEAMGGTIDFVSPAGQGTTFTVSFPTPMVPEAVDLVG